MGLKVRSVFTALKAHVAARDRIELLLLLGGLALLGIILVITSLTGEVLEGDTLEFDKRMLAALRKADNPAQPIGPAWLELMAFDITALGGPTVLGMTVLAVVGFLMLHGMYRNAAFVFVAAVGAWMLNDLLKEVFARPRPQVVPHLRQVMSLSFPSGHALTSAAVFLTLGALLMRFARTRLVKFYIMFIAMFATLLVGVTRVYLGVHYPTDVLAGWLIGISWALFCWLVERSLEHRAGLRQERIEHQHP